MYLHNVISRSFLLASWMSMTKIAESESISQRHGSGSVQCHGSATLLHRQGFAAYIWRSVTKIAGSGSISQRHRSGGSGSVPKCHGSATLLHRQGFAAYIWYLWGFTFLPIHCRDPDWWMMVYGQGLAVLGTHRPTRICRNVNKIVFLSEALSKSLFTDKKNCFYYF